MKYVEGLFTSCTAFLIIYCKFQLHSLYKTLKMSRFDPDKWGLSVCTVDGQRFTLGDVNEPFTIQSCSKPFTYGINLDKLGPEVVDKYIGQEPSGRDFNEICLDSKSKFLSLLTQNHIVQNINQIKPHRPLIDYQGFSRQGRSQIHKYTNP